MRARVLDTDHWYQFTLEDGPLFLDENDTVVLQLRPGTPLLDGKTICYGTNEYKVYEGNIILYNGATMLVTYKAGFHAVDETGQTHFLYGSNNLRVVGDYSQYPVFKNMFQPSYHCKYKAENKIFRLKDVLCYKVSGLYVPHVDRVVTFSEVKQSCRCYAYGKKLFFEDYMRQKPIVLAGGRVAVQQGTDFYDLSREEVLHGYQ